MDNSSKKRRADDNNGGRGRPSRSAAALNDAKRTNSLSIVHNTTTNTVATYAEDPTELYCVCRQPYDNRKFMIGCDTCDDWFHPKCLNMTMQEAETMAVFYCPACLRKEKDRDDKKDKRRKGNRNSTHVNTLPANMDYSMHATMPSAMNALNVDQAAALAARNVALAGVNDNFPAQSLAAAQSLANAASVVSARLREPTPMMNNGQMMSDPPAPMAMPIPASAMSVDSPDMAAAAAALHMHPEAADELLASPSGDIYLRYSLTEADICHLRNPLDVPDLVDLTSDEEAEVRYTTSSSLLAPTVLNPVLAGSTADTNPPGYGLRGGIPVTPLNAVDVDADEPSLWDGDAALEPLAAEAVAAQAQAQAKTKDRDTGLPQEVCVLDGSGRRLRKISDMFGDQRPPHIRALLLYQRALEQLVHRLSVKDAHRVMVAKLRDSGAIAAVTGGDSLLPTLGLELGDEEMEIPPTPGMVRVGNVEIPEDDPLFRTIVLAQPSAVPVCACKGLSRALVKDTDAPPLDFSPVSAPAAPQEDDAAVTAIACPCVRYAIDALRRAIKRRLAPVLTATQAGEVHAHTETETEKREGARGVGTAPEETRVNSPVPSADSEGNVQTDTTATAATNAGDVDGDCVSAEAGSSNASASASLTTRELLALTDFCAAVNTHVCIARSRGERRALNVHSLEAMAVTVAREMRSNVKELLRAVWDGAVLSLRALAYAAEGLSSIAAASDLARVERREEEEQLTAKGTRAAREKMLSGLVAGTDRRMSGASDTGTAAQRAAVVSEAEAARVNGEGVLHDAAARLRVALQNGDPDTALHGLKYAVMAAGEEMRALEAQKRQEHLSGARADAAGEDVKDDSNSPSHAAAGAAALVKTGGAAEMKTEAEAGVNTVGHTTTITHINNGSSHAHGNCNGHDVRSIVDSPESAAASATMADLDGVVSADGTLPIPAEQLAPLLPRTDAAAPIGEDVGAGVETGEMGKNAFPHIENTPSPSSETQPVADSEEAISRAHMSAVYGAPLSHASLVSPRELPENPCKCGREWCATTHAFEVFARRSSADIEAAPRPYLTLNTDPATTTGAAGTGAGADADAGAGASAPITPTLAYLVGQASYGRLAPRAMAVIGTLRQCLAAVADGAYGVCELEGLGGIQESAQITQAEREALAASLHAQHEREIAGGDPDAGALSPSQPGGPCLRSLALRGYEAPRGMWSDLVWPTDPLCLLSVAAPCQRPGESEVMPSLGPHHVVSIAEDADLSIPQGEPYFTAPAVLLRQHRPGQPAVAPASAEVAAAVAAEEDDFVKLEDEMRRREAEDRERLAREGKAPDERAGDIAGLRELRSHVVLKLSPLHVVFAHDVAAFARVMGDHAEETFEQLISSSLMPGEADLVVWSGLVQHRYNAECSLIRVETRRRQLLAALDYALRVTQLLRTRKRALPASAAATFTGVLSTSVAPDVHERLLPSRGARAADKDKESEEVKVDKAAVSMVDEESQSKSSTDAVDSNTRARSLLRSRVSALLHRVRDRRMQPGMPLANSGPATTTTDTTAIDAMGLPTPTVASTASNTASDGNTTTSTSISTAGAGVDAVRSVSSLLTPSVSVTSMHRFRAELDSLMAICNTPWTGRKQAPYGGNASTRATTDLGAGPGEVSVKAGKAKEEEEDEEGESDAEEDEESPSRKRARTAEVGGKVMTSLSPTTSTPASTSTSTSAAASTAAAVKGEMKEEQNTTPTSTSTPATTLAPSGMATQPSVVATDSVMKTDTTVTSTTTPTTNDTLIATSAPTGMLEASSVRVSDMEVDVNVDAEGRQMLPSQPSTGSSDMRDADTDTCTTTSTTTSNTPTPTASAAAAETAGNKAPLRTLLRARLSRDVLPCAGCGGFVPRHLFSRHTGECCVTPVGPDTKSALGRKWRPRATVLGGEVDRNGGDGVGKLDANASDVRDADAETADARTSTTDNTNATGTTSTSASSSSSSEATPEKPMMTVWDIPEVGPAYNPLHYDHNKCKFAVTRPTRNTAAVVHEGRPYGRHPALASSGCGYRAHTLAQSIVMTDRAQSVKNKLLTSSPSSLHGLRLRDLAICAFPLNQRDGALGYCLNSRDCPQHMLWQEFAIAELAHLQYIHSARISHLTAEAQSVQRRMVERTLAELNMLYRLSTDLAHTHTAGPRPNFLSLTHPSEAVPQTQDPTPLETLPVRLSPHETDALHSLATSMRHLMLPVSVLEALDARAQEIYGTPLQQLSQEHIQELYTAMSEQEQAPAVSAPLVSVEQKADAYYNKLTSLPLEQRIEVMVTDAHEFLGAIALLGLHFHHFLLYTEADKTTALTHMGELLDVAAQRRMTEVTQDCGDDAELLQKAQATLQNDYLVIRHAITCLHRVALALHTLSAELQEQLRVGSASLADDFINTNTVVGMGSGLSMCVGMGQGVPMNTRFGATVEAAVAAANSQQQAQQQQQQSQQQQQQQQQQRQGGQVHSNTQHAQGQSGDQRLLDNADAAQQHQLQQLLQAHLQATGGVAQGHLVGTTAGGAGGNVSTTGVNAGVHDALMALADANARNALNALGVSHGAGEGAHDTVLSARHEAAHGMGIAAHGMNPADTLNVDVNAHAQQLHAIVQAQMQRNAESATAAAAAEGESLAHSQMCQAQLEQVLMGLQECEVVNTEVLVQAVEFGHNMLRQGSVPESLFNAYVQQVRAIAASKGYTEN